MEAYMHNVEHESSQNDSAVMMTELPTGKERSWQRIFAGGTVFLVLVVILAGVLSSCSQPANSSTHSGSVAVPIPLSRSIPAPTAKPIIASVWSDHNVSVTTADDVAYIATDDNALYALRVNNGSMLWHTGIDGSVDELPVVANGIVYASSFVGQHGPAYLYALRASDGTVLWRYSGNSYIYSPTVDDGLVFVASQDEGITALRASDGTQLWHFATVQGPDSPISSVVNGMLYVSATVDGQSGGVIALRASDGGVLWRYSASNFVDTLMVSDGVIYITSHGMIAALRAGDGHQLWSRVIDTTFYQSLQLVDGVIYFMTTKYILENSTTPTAQNAGFLSQTMAIGALLASNESNGQATAVKETLPLKEGESAVYAIRASDGTVLWQYPMNKGGYSFADWLQVDHGVVYASGADAESSGDTGYFYALQSSDGSLIWQDKVSGSPSGTMLSNGVIYATVEAVSGSAVYALQVHDGALLWSYPIGGTVYSDPILVGTTLYVGAGNGIVYALRADNGAIVWHYLTNVGL
jgi:outer membrane protein assembly factor BamB